MHVRSSTVDHPVGTGGASRWLRERARLPSRITAPRVQLLVAALFVEIVGNEQPRGPMRRLASRQLSEVSTRSLGRVVTEPLLSQNRGRDSQSQHAG